MPVSEGVDRVCVPATESSWSRRCFSICENWAKGFIFCSYNTPKGDEGGKAGEGGWGGIKGLKV